MSVKLPFEMLPEMFYWVEVRRLGRPIHNLNPTNLEPSLGQFSGVFGVIVLLKNGLLQRNSQIFHTLGRCWSRIFTYCFYRSKCSQVRSDIHSSLLSSDLWSLLYMHNLVLIISIVLCVYCSNLPIVPSCVLFCPAHCSLHIM